MRLLQSSMVINLQKGKSEHMPETKSQEDVMMWQSARMRSSTLARRLSDQHPREPGCYGEGG